MNCSLQFFSTPTTTTFAGQLGLHEIVEKQNKIKTHAIKKKKKTFNIMNILQVIPICENGPLKRPCQQLKKLKIKEKQSNISLLEVFFPCKFFIVMCLKI